MAVPDPSELRDLALSLVLPIGPQLIDALSRDLHGDTKSSSTDLVTEMDRSVEARITAGLHEARPLDGIFGEEGAAVAGTSGVDWLIDPIDGTTNFVYGLPGFNISVGASFEGQVIAGVVVDPLHQDVFAAAIHAGATRNGQPIRCRTTTDLAMALLGTGFSYVPANRAQQADVLTTVLPRVRDIRRVGAAAIDLCWVACGRYDAFYERGLQPWDEAAGGLIASEAGATVGRLDDDGPGAACTVAAAPALFEPLRALLREAGAAEAMDPA